MPHSLKKLGMQLEHMQHTELALELNLAQIRLPGNDDGDR